MSRPRYKKDKHKETVRALVIQDLQLLLGAKPHLAKAFRGLSRRSQSDELRTFCKEGVTFRRVRRIKAALGKLAGPLVSRPSSGLDGLINDAKRAAVGSKSAETDVANLAAIERISHFGLAIYMTIDRYLRLAGIPEARRILVPSTMARKRLLPRVNRA
jgi:hypothetical protein